MLRIVLLALTLVGAASLTACNTVEGFGEDLQAGGQNIEKTANENK